MPNINSNLLNPTEILDIYRTPVLNDFERQKHSTLNKKEVYLSHIKSQVKLYIS